MRVAVVVILSVIAACSQNETTGSTTGSTAGPLPTATSRAPADTAITADTPTTPTTTPETAGVVVPEGFARTAAIVTTSDGDVCELCLWLADDADERRRGLMYVTDLGAADGMAFRYPEPTTRRFWMKDTVLELSIAFFADDGAYLDAFDMEPCTRDPCPRYRTPTDFVVAVEVVQGELDDLGIAPGSALQLLDAPCGA